MDDGLVRRVDFTGHAVVVRSENGTEYVQSLDNDGSYVPVTVYQNANS